MGKLLLGVGAVLHGSFLQFPLNFLQYPSIPPKNIKLSIKSPTLVNLQSKLALLKLCRPTCVIIVGIRSVS